jgi:hypothetical protein
MSIEAMFWDGGKRAMEVHVLAGTTSPDLRVAHLVFQTRDADNDPLDVYAKKYIDDHPGEITLTFTIADASKDPGKSTRSFAAFGITLDGTTGQVTAAPTLPTPFPQNFLLEVEASTAGQPPFRELIRVHVHRGINSIWLTPATLTVRPRRADTFPATTISRFALRARFDDLTVGDITDWPGIGWTSARGTTVTHHVNSDGRLIVESAGDAAAPAVTISARLPGQLLPPATATLRIVEPWKPETPIDVRLISGAGFPPTPPAPGTDPVPFASSLDAVPNVLIIPDGFPAGSNDSFIKYVTALVKFIKNETPLCKPYDVLTNSINFWAAFIESPQLGITWGAEVFSGLDSLIMSTLKPARPQELATGTLWDTEHLIYEVGVAAPQDRQTNTARTNDMILADWTALFGSTFRDHLPPDAAGVKSRIDFWRRLGERTILDDVDTPLGLLSGRPRVDSRNDDITFNPDRMDRERLNDLMSALRHEDVAHSGLQLDTVWTDPRKRNYDLVCIVTTGPGRAVNAFGYFILAQSSSLGFLVGTVSGVNTVAVNQFPILSELKIPNEGRVFAHELSHSFDLGDEYRGTNDRPLFPVWVEYAHRTQGNLQSPSTLTAAGGTVLNGDEIKWRWPRIRWAAEIIGPITDVGGTGTVFEASIRWSHAFAIPVGKTVHLRFRNIDFAYRDKTHDHVHFDDESAYLVKLPFVSIPLTLADTSETGTPPVKRVQLKVDPAAHFDYPAARTIAANLITTTFLPGSIVYMPTPAPPGAFDAVSYPYAEVLAKNVRDHITSMHAAVGHPSPPPAPSPFETWFGTMDTLPDDIPSKAYAFIVALSEGGIGNDVGVFHATRECMMANQDGASGYCHVCKYVLVDAIDPGKHYFLDPEYDGIYPQR